MPSKLPDYAAKHIERFDTSFEECAPGRNSGANEWSAFGAIGDRDFNCMGREMYVRYPLYDLGFRIVDGGKEVMPDSLDTFRLGLVNNRLPAIWGGWRHGDLLYKVSVMTVPDEKNGNFDLYKLEVQNPTDKAAGEQAGRRSRRAAGHAPGRRRGPRPGRRAVPHRRPAFRAGAQAPRVGAMRQAGEGVCDRPGTGRYRARGGKLPRGAGRGAGGLSGESGAGQEVCGLPGLDAAHRGLLAGETQAGRAS